MVRLKILIKEESTKPIEKTLAPTRIIADSKVGGKVDKKKCIGKLLGGVAMLIKLRAS